jgi:hypothetical protein
MWRGHRSWGTRTIDRACDRGASMSLSAETDTGRDDEWSIGSDGRRHPSRLIARPAEWIPVMPVDPQADLKVTWLNEGTAVVIDSGAYEELRIADRALVLRDWAGDDEILAGHEEVFGNGPQRVLVVRAPSLPTIAVVMGEEGSELLRIDLERPGWTRMAEVPRANNDVGGMRRLEILLQTGVTLLHWELGVPWILRSNSAGDTISSGTTGSSTSMTRRSGSTSCMKPKSCLR